MNNFIRVVFAEDCVFNGTSYRRGDVGTFVLTDQMSCTQLQQVQWEIRQLCESGKASVVPNCSIFGCKLCLLNDYCPIRQYTITSEDNSSVNSALDNLSKI